jgi:hypothetical protein
MRKILIEGNTLLDAEDRTTIDCWRSAADREGCACTTRCAAFSKAMIQIQAGQQELVAVCGMVPQVMPIGSLGAPSGLVVPAARPVIVKG